MNRFIAIAVQYRAQAADYSCAETFYAAMQARMEAARSYFRPELPALVAFPEDIGLGLVLAADYRRLRYCRTLKEAGSRLFLRHAAAVITARMRFGLPSITALLHVLSRHHVEAVYHDTFSRLAREYAVYLSAGSAPIAPDPNAGEVFNLSYLFGPTGQLLGAQRKTKLVPLEAEEGLRLNAAPVSALNPVRLPFASVGTAICFDAFHADALEMLGSRGANVLLQPSFNPKPWTPEQEAEWKSGLWQAMQDYSIFRAGINPMMVGGLFDVQGEGQSSIVAHRDRTPDGSGYLARAHSATDEEIIGAIIE